MPRVMRGICYLSTRNVPDDAVRIRPMNPPTLIVLHDAARASWLYFENPLEIIRIARLDEVIPALRRIETLVKKNGWYAAGLVSYEAAPAFDPAFVTRAPDAFPLLWFGLYAGPRIGPPPAPTDAAPALETWSPSVNRPTYDAAIDQIKTHIAHGETYQVNYTYRLKNRFTGNPWSLFTSMIRSQPVTYPAFVDTGRHVICCASPELFFALDKNQVTCRPMKGTAPRGRTLAEDEANAEALRSSLKQRAENVMIVDMLRNDLGRIARTGSVQVPALFQAERYRTLWQMTSTITARVDTSFTDVLAALFPCASITGAPKVRTMSIIAALESTPRGVYTGAIGFLAPDQRAQFNVAIRTAVIDRETETVEYGVGGGIVWDSTAGDEYAESLLKAKALTVPLEDFSLLETLRWAQPEGWFLREEHLRRLSDSARYFGFAFDQARVEARLMTLAKNFDGTRRVRLLLSPDGTLKDEVFELSPGPTKPVRARLARSPVDDSDVFLFHKTTRRAVYENTRAAQPDCDDVLLYNQRGELTEFTIGNLVVELNDPSTGSGQGQFFTPPIACGLLAGTFRAHLLAQGVIQERIIHREELAHCTKLFLINSVRGWVQVDLQNE